MATDTATRRGPRWNSHHRSRSNEGSLSQRRGDWTGPLEMPVLPRDARSQKLIAQITWAFVALGIVLRLTRYLLRPPIWGDESFVAANFIDGSYLDMMRPLQYHQVAPLLFLWIELTVVKLIGFSEWSLRLFPTLCSLSSVLLFRHVAMRLFRGVPLVLAVGIFAVSYYPIRHGNEVKPYASDLLVALVLVALAIGWLRAPEQRGWLWALAGFAPLALAVSHPAVFVAGGISAALVVAVWKTREPASPNRSNQQLKAGATGGLAASALSYNKGRPPENADGAPLPMAPKSTLVAYGAFNFTLAASFLLIFAAFTSAQYDVEFEGGTMQRCWQQAFPPLGEPLRLAGWLAQTHTSHMFAYPVGGARGASTLTFLGVAAAAFALWRRRQRTVLAVLLAPLVLTFFAAAIQRYPYGGSARTMQFIAPAVCLLAGLGAAALIALVRNNRRRVWALGLTIGLLAVIGLGSLARDFTKPYKTIYDRRARDFARWFWNEKATEAQLVCAWADLGQDLYPGCFDWGNSAAYLCNRRFFAPRRGVQGPVPDWRAVSRERPLRCVVYSMAAVARDEVAFARWMEEMTERFDLVSREEFTVNAGTDIYRERYELYEFVPKDSLTAAKEGRRRFIGASVRLLARKQ